MNAYAYLHPAEGWTPFSAGSQSKARRFVMGLRVANQWPVTPRMTRLAWADALAGADGGAPSIPADLWRAHGFACNDAGGEVLEAKPRHFWSPPLSFGRSSTCLDCGVRRVDSLEYVVWISPSGECVKKSRYATISPWVCGKGGKGEG